MTGVLASRAQAARTLLFVPGDRPDRFDRALTSGAGLVVLDLEDAVVPQAKETAREAVSAALARGTTCAVRVNAAGTPWHEDDLAMLSRWPAVVMLPKVEDPASVEALVDRLGAERPVVALVESSRGILSAPRIAEAGVCRLALGTFDLAAELGVSPDDRDAMLSARAALVLASAAAGLPGPVDGVTAAVRDAEALRSDTAYGRRLGLTGKLCIHPDQVAGADRALLPAPEELAWASAVLAAAHQAGEGVVLLDGRMVDKPVVDRARRIVAAVEAR